MSAVDPDAAERATGWLRRSELILPTRTQAAIDLLLDEYDRRGALLADIAAAHCELPDGTCLECAHPWPCTTRTWATTDRDPATLRRHPTEDREVSS
jgi:hypothetical protein